MQDKLRVLIEKHCATLKADAVALNTALVRMTERSDDSAAGLSDALFVAHRLKGSSGTIGFVQVSDLAHRLEQVLIDLEDSQRPPDERQCEVVLALNETLQRSVETISVDQSALLQR
uniref:Hpt domain-containing protein n=1 Tax=Pararhizobium sp. IMCC3301 TaxID=3067904 RepID=UPI0027424B44|nr:Hpt domain-containing protein [Pararhizobium sp. IMCC3301]